MLHAQSFLKGKKVNIEVELNGTEGRRQAKGSSNEDVFVYMGDETVSGTVTVSTKKPFEHLGVNISFVGQLELKESKNHPIIFAAAETAASPAGVLEGDHRYTFSFADVEKKHESYTGINACVRYFVRVTVLQKYGDVVKENEIFVQRYDVMPAENKGIKMEVGIAECLHIEIEYIHTTHHLQDVVIGKVFFLLSRIKVKHMAISLVRRETVAVGADHVSERKILAKYEIMDGEPVRGECIPIRMFLGAYELTPTYAKVEGKFSVRYYLSLGIIDSDDRRYFKQHEITLWRSSAEGDVARRDLGAFREVLDKQGN